MTPGQKRGFTALASVVLATAALGGTVSAQDPEPGGTLVMGEWQAASQLNPFFSNAFANTEAYTPVLRTPYTINNAGEWVGDLGTEIPTIANGALVPDEDGDGFTVTVSLKPGLLWSDGETLDMNDFKYTYQYAVDTAKAGLGCIGCGVFVPLIDPSLGQEDPENPDLEATYAADNQYVQAIEVSEDGLSADITFAKNYAGWLGWTSAYPMLPEHYFSTIPLDQGNAVLAVGSPTLTDMPWSGPFVITSASSEGIDYARNPNWKATEGPYLDELRFRFFGSKDGMITSFLNNEIDVALDMTQADYPAISGVSPDIGRADLDSVWQYEHLDLNTSRPGLDDINVRTAIAMAINKPDLIAVLFPGTELEPACSPAPPGTWWRIETECPAFDPEGAMALLDESGWLVDETTGLRTKDGVALQFNICTSAGNPSRLTTVGKVNQYLNAIGIPTTIQTADAASVYFAGWADTTPETQCSLYRGTYDLALFAYVLGGDLYQNYYYTYHSSQIPSDANPNGGNDTRISSPDLDAALDALGVEIDIEAQKAAAAVIQTEYAKAIAEIPLYYRAETTGISNHVGGYEKYNPSSAGPTWDVEKWFFIP